MAGFEEDAGVGGAGAAVEVVLEIEAGVGGDEGVGGAGGGGEGEDAVVAGAVVAGGGVGADGGGELRDGEGGGEGEGADFEVAEGDDAVVDLEGEGGVAAGLATEGDFAFGAFALGEGGRGGGGVEIDVDEFFAVEPVFDVEAMDEDAGLMPDVGSGGGGAAGGDVVVEGAGGVAGGGEGVGVGEVVGDLVFEAGGFEALLFGEGLDAVLDAGVGAGGGAPGEAEFEVGEGGFGEEIDGFAAAGGGDQGAVGDLQEGVGAGDWALQRQPAREWPLNRSCQPAWISAGVRVLGWAGRRAAANRKSRGRMGV